MAVYVDDMEASYRGMTMCHMVADTTDELLAMADKIGVQRKWLQLPGTAREHFDICKTKRARAVRLGAIQITMRQATAMTVRRRVLGFLGSPADAEEWHSSQRATRRAQLTARAAAVQAAFARGAAIEVTK